LRNPWAFTFDAATGDLWLADVGQDAVEEIDVARAADTPGGAGKGINFGWNAFEGSDVYDASVSAPGALAPIYDYPHGSGPEQGCSVTGGVVYRGDKVANLSGAYLFADYCVAGLRGLEASGDIDPRVLLEEPSAVTGFGFDPNGEVLVATLDGAVYRLE
jgi:glucose/arabinose dehydrogenase